MFQGMIRFVHLPDRKPVRSIVKDLSHTFFIGVDSVEGAALGRASAPSRATRHIGRRWKPHRLTPVGEDKEPLSPLILWVLRQFRLDGSGFRPEALRRRLPACLRTLRSSSEEAARVLLEKQPDLLPRVLSALLIGVSGFFRDESVFEQMRTAVLPELLNANPALRVYSAGCSKGQELYSAAIILDELGGLERSYLRGVDCRGDAIQEAQTGWFDAAELEHVNPARRSRYFSWIGRRALISERLRDQMDWRLADLTRPDPSELWDLVLFRNVSIYLETERGHRLWRKLADQLRPGGVLVTGKAERPPVELDLRRIGACIYRKPNP
jgi:chemotaxis protein methyltransferase CheR